MDGFDPMQSFGGWQCEPFPARSKRHIGVYGR